MSTVLSPELLLTAACCRWPPSAARETAVREAAAAVDWDRFERVVARNRVTAIVRDGLRRAGVVPPPALERRFAAAAATAGRTALVMAHEHLRLQTVFDQAGVPAVFMKGSSLGILAYGDLGVKESWDIDLLTTPQTAVAARRLLEASGYEMTLPANFDDARFLTLIEVSKECVFTHRPSGMSVELHWRLIDNPHLLPGLDAGSPTQLAPLAETGIRTFEDDALFAYVCVHGTLHGWARLKWLADVGALLSGRDAAEIERMYRASLTAGGGRSPGVALLLCHRLLGLELAPALLAELRGDWATRFIEEASLACIGYGDGATDFAPYSSAGLKLMASHLLLVADRRYLWRELKIKWASPHDQLTMDLPGYARFLHHLLRLPRWALRQVGTQLRRRNA